MKCEIIPVPEEESVAVIVGNFKYLITSAEIAVLLITEVKIMTNEQMIKVNGIIHTASASAAAVGGGLANIPGSDSPVLVGIQSVMIISIGAVFGIHITEAYAKVMLAEFLGANIGKLAANILVGWIPGIGNIINATTAAGVTELIGWIAANQFDEETSK